VDVQPFLAPSPFSLKREKEQTKRKRTEECSRSTESLLNGWEPVSNVMESQGELGQKKMPLNCGNCEY